MKVDEESIEKTKQQIKALVTEIQDLSKSSVPAEEYYPEVLQRIIQALAAAGGAIWLFDQDRDLRLTYHINCNSMMEESEDSQRHHRLMQRIANSGQSLLVPPFSGTTDGEGEGNPTKYLLIIAPLKGETQTEGLIEIFQRPEAPVKTQQGYLKFLLQMATVVGDWVKGHELRQLGSRQMLWQQADTFARSTHESLDLRQTCYTLANEGRRLIGCDRVSVAILRGNRCKVEAISGQDTIENRSNIVAALNKLATRVCRAGEPLWHDGKTEDLPPQIEEAVEEYVDLSYGRNIAVLPLREPQKNQPSTASATGQLDRDNAHRGRVIGALIIEQIESNLPIEVLRARSDLVYEHGTRAVANSLSHSSLFLMPLWRTLGKVSWLTSGSRLWKTMAVTTGLILAGLFLTFFQIDFDLKAEGSLKPDVIANIFAKVDGEVTQLHVKHDQRVAIGSPLVDMKNEELRSELKKTEGEATVTAKRIEDHEKELSSRTLKDEERLKLGGDKNELVVTLANLIDRAKIQREKSNSLNLVSPINGIVMTWDVDQVISIGRPVATGNLLLEIADLDQPWHLQVLMPEKRMRHLDHALKHAQGKPLDVKFILATDPDQKFTGKMIEVEGRSSTNSAGEAVNRLRVIPDDLQKIARHPEARVVAHVKCGRAPAGYVWFYSVYEWLVTQWFWLF
jgi:hypothetical protein